MATKQLLLSLLALTATACVPTVRTPLKQALPSVLGDNGAPPPCWQEVAQVSLPGPVRAATLADLDRNGALDLAAIAGGDGGSSLLFAFNSGAGDLSRTTSLRLNGEPVAIAAGDLNLDGSVDLMVASKPVGEREPSAVHVLLGDGAGGFIAGATPLPFAPGALFAVDLDANDVLDAVVVDGAGERLVTLLGNGRGELEVAERVRLPGVDVGSIAFADFDSDRIIDMATLHDRGDKATITLHRGDGGDFRPQMRIEVGAAGRALAAGDMNNDGYADLVALTDGGDGAQPSAVLLLGNGAQDPDFLGVRYFGPAGAASLHLVDVDRDGFRDLLAPRRSRDGVDQILGDRRGGLGKLGGSPLPANTDALLIGDLDRDGYPELLGLSQARAGAVVLRAGACAQPSASAP